MKKQKLSFFTVGASSIATVLFVLCFTLFAVLSLSTATTNADLADKAMEGVIAYYRADFLAEEILAKLRKGIRLEEVKKKGNLYQYSCAIDENQELQVEVLIEKDRYQVRKWKKVYIGSWEPETSLSVWDGTEILE